MDRTQCETPGTEGRTVTCSMKNSNTSSVSMPSELKNIPYIIGDNDGNGDYNEIEIVPCAISEKDTAKINDLIDAINDAIDDTSDLYDPITFVSSHFDTQEENLPVDRDPVILSLETNETCTILAEENAQLKETIRYQLLMIDENTKLKETIEYQLNMIDSLQDELSELHELHDKKTREVARLVNSNNNLKKENVKLRDILAKHQTEHCFEEINEEPNFDTNHFSDEVISLKEASASSLTEEEKNTLPNEQQILDNDAKQKIEQKSLLENDEKQISCEQDTSDDDFVKLEAFDPQIIFKTKDIYNIHNLDNIFTEIHPAFQCHDQIYEATVSNYNIKMQELPQNFSDFTKLTIRITEYLRSILTLLELLGNDDGTFEGNVALLKQMFAEYKIKMSLHNCSYLVDDINNYISKFCEILKDIQSNISDIFMNYEDNIYALHMLTEEHLKMNNKDLHYNWQEKPWQELRHEIDLLSTQHFKLDDQIDFYENLNCKTDMDKKYIKEVKILHQQLIQRKRLLDGKARILLNEKRSLMQRQKIDVADLLEKYKMKSTECEKLQHELNENMEKCETKSSKCVKLQHELNQSMQRCEITNKTCEKLQHKLNQNLADVNLCKQKLSMYKVKLEQEEKCYKSLQIEKTELCGELHKLQKYYKLLKDFLSSSKSREFIRDDYYFKVALKCLKLITENRLSLCPLCNVRFHNHHHMYDHLYIHYNEDIG